MVRDPLTVRPIAGFVGALQFLTRVPVRTRRPAPLGATIPWFPVVGVLVGAAVATVAIIVDKLVGGFGLAAAATAVVFGALLTGALHEDGLADTLDAVGGGPTHERRFEILADSHLGTYGVASVTGSMLVRTAAIAALTTAGRSSMIAAVVTAHVVARSAIVAAAAVTPVAVAPGAVAPAGLGARFADAITIRTSALAVLLGVGFAVVATGWWSFGLLASAAVAGVGTLAIARRALGGITGDVLGAVEQAVEAAVLLAACAFATRYQIWWHPDAW